MWKVIGLEIAGDPIPQQDDHGVFGYSAKVEAMTADRTPIPLMVDIKASLDTPETLRDRQIFERAAQKLKAIDDIDSASVDKALEEVIAKFCR